MSWTVACFCGTVFHAPLDRCPTCGTPLPDVSRVEQRTLTDKNAQVLRLAISGWQVIPSTPAGSPPIAGRVWLAAALNARGRYRALAISFLSPNLAGTTSPLPASSASSAMTSPAHNASSTTPWW